MRRLLPGGLLALLLLLPACAPSLKGLGGDERGAAERFFRMRWASVPFPVRASWAGTATTPSGVWPVLLGVEALAPDRETASVYDPFGREVVTVRNTAGILSLFAGPLAGPLVPLDRKNLPLPGFSVGRLVAGAPAFEPAEGEYLRGPSGEWVLEAKGQRVATDPERRRIASASYRLYGKDLSVSYPGWNGEGAPPAISIEGGGVSVSVRRDPD